MTRRKFTSKFKTKVVLEALKERATKTELFTQILKQIEATKGEIKFASATFHLVEAPEFTINLKK
jgi:hypothetical protein